MRNASSLAQETLVRDIILRKEGEVPSYASEDLAKIRDF